MERTIADLITSYEKGALSRRELIGALSALTFASTGASAATSEFQSGPAPTFKVMGFNHFFVNCANLERSVDFYQHVIGLPVVDQVPARKVIRMGIGSHGEQIELHQAGYTRDGVYVGDKNPPGLDHIALGIDNWSMKSIDAYIRARGFVPRGLHGEPAGAAGGDHIRDPDGILIQLMQFPKA
jgi:catechol 2,3-dioxygenase-like lactoylglutathione lyase family enzyme